MIDPSEYELRESEFTLRTTSETPHKVSTVANF